MGILGFFSYTASDKVEPATGERHVSLESTSVVVASAPPMDASTSKPMDNAIGKIASSIITAETVVSAQSKASVDQTKGHDPSPFVEAQVKLRRFSFRSFGFIGKDSSEQKPALTAIQEYGKREQATQDFAKRAQKIQLSTSDKRAQKSALTLRAFIIGPTTGVAPQLTPATARPQLSMLKTQLMQPKTANKLIAQLRELPANDEQLATDHSHHLKGPIHAVCLEHTDDEEHRLHFSKLMSTGTGGEMSAQTVNFPGVVSPPLQELTNMFNEMHIVDLVSSPDFGLGQPGNGKGILAGAVPTAETVIQGFRQITPELMALGYATGKAITPDHSGLHPPTDRMSILTYWWGLELLLPPPSLVYLARGQSVSGALINFLSALALVNNGVREILPFVRYISQFVDFEFSTIKAQNKGRGVVCAATWIMPAALVPRPWDFPVSQAPTTKPGDESETQPSRSTMPVGGVILQPNPLSMGSLLDLVSTSATPQSPTKAHGTAIQASA
ncbi:hypothetical protein BDZ97DRAFT_1912846 [Flammula alnicola]|nr:hypothetical protein BDZ97DRAFT_1912846 [Flammula alnicola]